MENFTEELNILSNKAHPLPFIGGFMQNFGSETDNFIHLTPFDDFVVANIETYDLNGTIGAPKRSENRPSKPKLGFYLNNFVSQLKVKCEKIGPLGQIKLMN